jgi:hypothetical protein
MVQPEQDETNALAKAAYAAFEASMNATPYAVGRWDELPSAYRDGYEAMCQEAVRLQSGQGPTA